MRKSWIAFVFSLFVINASSSQLKRKTQKETKTPKERSIIVGDSGEDTSRYVGTASFYADKFSGRKTATGESYIHKKISAACNILPLGTWIRVTNLKNMHSVIVQINDRLHRKNTRIVDLSLAGAQVLGYIKHGLTQVRLEVLSDGMALQ